MCHIFAKGFLDSNFYEAVIDNLSIFHKIAPNFINLQNHNILNIRNRPTASTLYILMAWACKEYTFSFLPVVSR